MSQATQLTALQAAADAIAAEIQTVSTTLGPTYNKNGQTVDKIGFLKELQEQLKANYDAQVACAPYEIRSTMVGTFWPPGCPQG